MDPTASDSSLQNLLTQTRECIYFTVRFPPTFYCFTSMIGCIFLMKDKRINNADLFSQPPFLIFTKSANISGGHCMCIYIYTHTHTYIYIYTVHIIYLFTWNLSELKGTKNSLIFTNIWAQTFSNNILYQSFHLFLIIHLFPEMFLVWEREHVTLISL